MSAERMCERAVQTFGGLLVLVTLHSPIPTTVISVRYYYYLLELNLQASTTSVVTLTIFNFDTSRMRIRVFMRTFRLLNTQRPSYFGRWSANLQ